MIKVPDFGRGNAGSPQTALGRLNTQDRAEYWAALALRWAKGIGARTICRLLKHFGSAYASVHNVSQWDEAGVPSAKGSVLAQKSWRNLARPEWEDARDLPGHIILWTNPLYPPQLKEIPDAPALLYARGDLSLLSSRCVAIVGSRVCARTSIDLAQTIAADLSRSGLTIVSGLARGIDTAAHVGALRGSGSTIAVLGSGLDIIYPLENIHLYAQVGQQGLLLSEFPPGTLPEGRHFPIRNRIISGLSLGVLVAQASLKSGSMVTARLALEQNRSVYAPNCPLPEDDTQPADGCAQLLLHGATPIDSATDILLDLAPLLDGPYVPPVPPTSSKKLRSVFPAKLDKFISRPKEKALPNKVARSIPDYSQDSLEWKIMDALRQYGPLHPDKLAAYINNSAPPGQLSAALAMMELQGATRRLPGFLYEAN